MFFLFIGFIILQRMIEMFIAKRNERWTRERGAIEFGQRHYKYIVLLHICFLVSTVWEVMVFHKQLSLIWPYLLTGFVAAQFLRVWAIASLGYYWNTKILVVPKADIVQKGPYRLMRHPNYLVVMVEFFVIPFMFKAYITACLFSVLNIIILSVRIKEEEKALASRTNYGEVFENISRFKP
ncbi:hypothetical protein J7Q84_00585 [Bacillus sp. 165]|nr:hypothetical protein [Bacillus sp. 165]